MSVHRMGALLKYPPGGEGAQFHAREPVIKIQYGHYKPQLYKHKVDPNIVNQKNNNSN